MSADFNALKLNPENGRWVSAVPDNLTRPYIVTESDMDEWPRNPEFDSAFDFNVSSSNASSIKYALEWYGPLTPIDDFIKISQAWLKKNLGSPSPEVPQTDIGHPGGARVIDCGLREGYLNEKIHAMVVFAQRAKAEHQATHVIFD